MNNSLLPKVVVLLAAHNGMRWAEEQVNSILAQKGVDVSLIVSVDASEDGSEAWFAELTQQDERISVLPQGQHEGGAAGNFFRLIAEVPAGDAEHVAFADQDDIWLPDKLQHAVMTIKQKDIDAYSGNVRAVWEDGHEKMIEKSQPQREWDFLFEAAGPGCTYVFTPAFYNALREFVRSHSSEMKSVYLHDWFFYAFARSRGFAWFIDPEPKMFYRQHSSNQVGVNTGIKAVITRCRNIGNGWWLGQARTIARILDLQNDAFVRPWITPGRRMGYLHLMKNVFRCRRKASDAAFMGVIMAVMWVLNP
ncbi:glycosyltransferase [Halopseudomonas laoshanensis]|nr:glycosyltransferase [Halopseudomonas laoshanensis]